MTWLFLGSRFPVEDGLHDQTMPKLGGEIPTELQSCVSEVALVCDIVTIKYRPGFMAGDVHGDAFGYPTRTKLRTPVCRRWNGLLGGVGCRRFTAAICGCAGGRRNVDAERPSAGRP